MPKAKYAHREKPKPKSIKAKKVLSSKRLEKRTGGKRQRGGYTGTAVEYIARTKAIKKLQISIKDFRRLCILKGIYPRDPPNQKFLASKQTHYHYKDIQFLMHEPILNKFREFKTFSKKFARAIGLKNVKEAQYLYENHPRYTLDHVIKERYPRFADALADIDDALSMVHMFATLPAEPPVKADHTATAKRITREFQYFVARTNALRKVFFSIRGIYFQAEIKGVPITWLVPWQFSQALPSDVDYRVMLTFLELYETVMKFTLFKCYSDIGLDYPPKIVEERDSTGAHLSALSVASIGSASSAVAAEAAIAAPDAKVAEKIASLRGNMKAILSKAGATGDSSSSTTTVVSGAVDKKQGVDFYSFVDQEEELPSLESNLNEFTSSEEAKETLEKAKKLAQFKGLFKGLVFFLNREVPREAFEFMITAFRGRVGWAGPGSPFEESDPRITHHVVDRPMEGVSRVEGREYVQPQWVADSVNARMLLPIHPYAPGAVLPPHLSPFVDDHQEGYVPAYRAELERLRAAAAVTGRLADVIDPSVSAGNGVETGDDHDDSDEDDEEDEDEDDEDEDDDDDDEEDEDEDEEDALEQLENLKKDKSVKNSIKGLVSTSGLIKGKSAAEIERMKLAASMLTNKQRKLYDAVDKKATKKSDALQVLANKRKLAEDQGDMGLGGVSQKSKKSKK